MSESNFKLTEDDRERLLKLRFNGNKLAYSIDDIKAMIRKEKPTPGEDIRLHTLVFHGNIRVVYSIEEQPQSVCRHVSISYPGRDVVQMNLEPKGIEKEIMDVLGFDDSEMYCWFEHAAKAVNYLQKISEAT